MRWGDVDFILQRLEPIMKDEELRRHVLEALEFDPSVDATGASDFVTFAQTVGFALPWPGRHFISAKHGNAL